MSNIVQFPQPRQGDSLEHGAKSPQTTLDEILDALAASIVAPMTNEEKKIFMKRLKGILKTRDIPFRCSPPPGLEAPKNPFTLFFVEAKVAFLLGLKKKKTFADGWVFYPLNEASPVDAAGSVISTIGELKNGTT
jgi:hypothetical protein